MRYPPPQAPHNPGGARCATRPVHPVPSGVRGATRPAAVPSAYSTHPLPLPPAGQADKFLRPGDPCGWAGISCFVGTAVILLAAFVMRAGTLPPESAY